MCTCTTCRVPTTVLSMRVLRVLPVYHTHVVPRTSGTTTYTPRTCTTTTTFQGTYWNRYSTLRLTLVTEVQVGMNWCVIVYRLAEMRAQMVLLAPKPEKSSAIINNLKILLVFRLKIWGFLGVSELSALGTTNLPSSHHPNHNIWQITTTIHPHIHIFNKSIHANHPSPKIIIVRNYPPSWSMQIFFKTEVNKSTKSFTKVGEITHSAISNVSLKSRKLHGQAQHSLELFFITIAPVINFSLLSIPT